MTKETIIQTLRLRKNGLEKAVKNESLDYIKKSHQTRLDEVNFILSLIPMNRVGGYCENCHKKITTKIIYSDFKCECCEDM